MSLTRLWFLFHAGVMGYGVYLAYSRDYHLRAFFFSLGVVLNLALVMVSYPRKKP